MKNLKFWTNWQMPETERREIYTWRAEMILAAGLLLLGILWCLGLRADHQVMVWSVWPLIVAHYLWTTIEPNKGWREAVEQSLAVLTLVVLFVGIPFDIIAGTRVELDFGFTSMYTRQTVTTGPLGLFLILASLALIGWNFYADTEMGRKEARIYCDNLNKFGHSLARHFLTVVSFVGVVLKLVARFLKGIFVDPFVRQYHNRGEVQKTKKDGSSKFAGLKARVATLRAKLRKEQPESGEKKPAKKVNPESTTLPRRPNAKSTPRLVSSPRPAPVEPVVLPEPKEVAEEPEKVAVPPTPPAPAPFQPTPRPARSEESRPGNGRRHFLETAFREGQTADGSLRATIGYAMLDEKRRQQLAELVKSVDVDPQLLQNIADGATDDKNREGKSVKRFKYQDITAFLGAMRGKDEIYEKVMDIIFAH